MPADSVSRMDTNASNNDSNVSDNILGTSPGTSSLRERTESESSDKVARFILPSMDGSPPKVLTLNEVSNVFKNIQNMELAHEIALNPDFKLQPFEPPEDSLERRIKDIVHKAFWDILREDLQRTPPSYQQAIQLLDDIKECFPQIISPNNKRALEHINAVLDPAVIRQQVENNVLDFRSYATFVIQIMARSCAPARDETVRKLNDIEDVVDMFKGILDTMTLMKLDMANYLLDFARNDIMANSVEYEKEKFKEYLEYYKFGFPATEAWLKRNLTTEANSSVGVSIFNAYMELMDWNTVYDFPEVYAIDKERILKLGQRGKRLCVCASLISICSAVPIISQRPETRSTLAKQIEILMQGATNDTEITETIENVWMQIKTVINEAMQKEHQTIMDATAENMLKTQVLQVGTPTSPVRNLMWKRLQDYFRLILRSKVSIPPPPSGYADFKDELEMYTTALKRVITYNHSVFGDYFLKLLTQQRPQTASSIAATGSATATATATTATTTTTSATAAADSAAGAAAAADTAAEAHATATKDESNTAQ